MHFNELNQKKFCRSWTYIDTQMSDDTGYNNDERARHLQTADAKPRGKYVQV